MIVFMIASGVILGLYSLSYQFSRRTFPHVTKASHKLFIALLYPLIMLSYYVCAFLNFCLSKWNISCYFEVSYIALVPARDSDLVTIIKELEGSEDSIKSNTYEEEPKKRILH